MPAFASVIGATVNSSSGSISVYSPFGFCTINFLIAGPLPTLLTTLPATSPLSSKYSAPSSKSFAFIKVGCGASTPVSGSPILGMSSPCVTDGLPKSCLGALTGAAVALATAPVDCCPTGVGAPACNPYSLRTCVRVLMSVNFISSSIS